ncbi:unnamed protein product [Nezara viridula]|uniref:Uncharacterized protein n=1 Tax=Nezara viridula TaxID=85310 RepID=A0A9P0MUR1_NEZVI|nr:unnamed protein product [Nezara viridula]
MRIIWWKIKINLYSKNEQK